MTNLLLSSSVLHSHGSIDLSLVSTAMANCFSRAVTCMMGFHIYEIAFVRCGLVGLSLWKLDMSVQLNWGLECVPNNAFPSSYTSLWRWEHAE